MPLPALLGAALASPVIGGVINGISSIFTNKSNENINARNLQWQTEQNALNRNFEEGQQGRALGFQNYWNQKSLDWQEKMWNLQNQYNSPSAMMGRYKEAHLNPYLNVLSQMGSGAGAAQAPPQASTNNSAPVGTPAMAGSPYAIPMQAPRFDILGAMGVSANVANQNSQALLNVSKSLPELGKSLGWDVARKVAMDVLGMQGVRGSQAERLIESQISSIELQNQFQTIQNSIAQKYGDRKAGLECSNLEQSFTKISAEIGKMASDVKVNESQISKNKAEIRRMASEFVRNHAEALKMAAETQTINQLREYVVSSARHQASMLGMQDTTQKALFNGSAGIREYLNYGEGVSTLRDAFILKAERDADEFWSLVLQLGNVNVGANVHN